MPSSLSGYVDELLTVIEGGCCVNHKIRAAILLRDGNILGEKKLLLTHAYTQFGVGRLWWFNYPGLLLHSE